MIFIERQLFQNIWKIGKRKYGFFVKGYDNTVHETNKEKLHIIQLLRTVLHMLKQLFLYSCNLCLGRFLYCSRQVCHIDRVVIC